jgi:hypothetical protein
LLLVVVVVVVEKEEKRSGDGADLNNGLFTFKSLHVFGDNN